MAERYTHDVSDAEIETLKKKLELTTFPDEVQDGEEWQFGVPLAKMRQLTEYWKDGFDFKRAFSSLNELPQFLTTVSLDRIGNVNIHYVHQVNANPASIPLLFCHGCMFTSDLLLLLLLLPLLFFTDVVSDRAGLVHRSFQTTRTAKRG